MNSSTPRRWQTCFAVLLFFVPALLTGCGVMIDGDPGQVPGYEVTYKLEYTSGAEVDSVSYLDSFGTTQTVSFPDPGWTMTVPGFQSGDDVAISATAQAPSGESVTISYDANDDVGDDVNQQQSCTSQPFNDTDCEGFVLTGTLP